MPDHLKPEEINTKIETIQSEFSRLRGDMLEERVRRAEKVAESIRNLFTIWAIIVSVVLGMYAFLGFRSYSDIQANQKRVQDDATSVSEKAKEVEETAKRAGQVVGNLEGRVATLESHLSPLGNRYDTMQAKTAKLEADVERASKLAQQARIGAANNTTALVTFGAGQPTIFSVPLTVAENFVSGLQGNGFGDTQGRLYVRVEYGLASSDPIQITSPYIEKWSDSNIGFTLSSELRAALLKARDGLQSNGPLAGSPFPISASLSFQAATASGSKSGWSSTLLWPIP
jgi:hypothetical protein